MLHAQKKENLLTGTAIFECKMKADKGLVTVIKEGASKPAGEMVFEGDGTCTFKYTATLEPGKYNWFFTDSDNNKTNGTLTVKKATVSKIFVLENMNTNK